MKRFKPLIVCLACSTLPVMGAGEATGEYPSLPPETEMPAAQSERFGALASPPTFENRPTEESARLLMDELLFQRASQT